MATVDELKSVLKETLNKRGVLGQLKARIRAEVFQALDDQSEPRPKLCNENLIINELIREYLEFNQYRYSASVLKAESGQPETPLTRDLLKRELNLVDDKDIANIPLLYGIVSHFAYKNRGPGDEGIPSSPPKLPPRSASPSARNISIHQPQEEMDAPTH